MAAVPGYNRDEVAYVGDRLDNDIAPAAQARLLTVWLRRGPWGYILNPGESLTAVDLPENAPSLTVSSLSELVNKLTDDHAQRRGAD